LGDFEEKKQKFQKIKNKRITQINKATTLLNIKEKDLLLKENNLITLDKKIKNQILRMKIHNNKYGNRSK